MSKTDHKEILGMISPTIKCRLESKEYYLNGKYAKWALVDMQNEKIG